MISVVIPSFGQKQFLAGCVNSVLNQTKSPSEVIIVDDGSTDGSLDLARTFAGTKKGRDGNYFKVKVVSQVNKGLASARNTGIMNSIGNYVAFLDADDQFEKNFIERINQEIHKSQADIIAPSCRCFGLSNQEIILMQNPKLEDFHVGDKPTNRLGYCTAIKRSALLEVGGYSPKMTWGAEDLHLWFNLLSLGKKLVTLQEVLWLYRTKESSMWTETAKYEKEFMNQIKKDFKW